MRDEDSPQVVVIVPHTQPSSSSVVDIGRCTFPSSPDFPVSVKNKTSLLRKSHKALQTIVMSPDHEELFVVSMAGLNADLRADAVRLFVFNQTTLPSERAVRVPPSKSRFSTTEDDDTDDEERPLKRKKHPLRRQKSMREIRESPPPSPTTAQPVVGAETRRAFQLAIATEISKLNASAAAVDKAVAGIAVTVDLKCHEPDKVLESNPSYDDYIEACETMAAYDRPEDAKQGKFIAGSIDISKESDISEEASEVRSSDVEFLDD